MSDKLAGEFYHLLSDAHRRGQMSVAPATRKRYEAVLRRFDAHCAHFGYYEAAPTADACIVTFLETEAQRAEEGEHSGSLVALAGAALGWGYETLHGLPNPTTSPLARRIISAAKRQLPSGTPLQRRALSPEELRALVDRFAPPEPAPVNLQDLMHTVGAVLAFCGYLRGDCLAHVLVHADYLRITPSGVTITLPGSKTDQAGNGSVVHIPRGDNPTYCPVQLLERLLRVGGYDQQPPEGQDAGPLMRAVKWEKGTAYLRQVSAPLTQPIPSLSTDTLRNHLRRLLQLVGVDTSGVGYHSLKIGAATAAALDGQSLLEIKTAGRWASFSSAARYPRAPVAAAPTKKAKLAPRQPYQR
jgi:hypothetical protein